MAESKTRPGNELRTIATFNTPEEAEVARLALQSAGIFTAFEGWATVGMLWHLGTAVGWVKLQVPEADEERARAVLFPSAAPAAAERACGKCGAPLPSGFDTCWSCEASTDELPGAGKDAAAKPADRPPVVPAAEETKNPEFDEPQEAPTDPADKKAWRALAAAIVGLFALPPLLHVYSASVLVRLLGGGDPLSRRGKFQCLAAAVIDCAVGGMIVLLVWLSSPAWHPSGRGAQVVPVSARRVDLGSLDGPGLPTLIEGKKGQVVLVDFWATWCAPCVALLPHTVELYDRFQPRGLAVITVSLDEPEERLAVLKFLVDRRAATENYLAPYGASSAAVSAFGIDGGTLPHVRLYDRQGRLARSFSGDIRADEVRRAVEDLLGKD